MIRVTTAVCMLMAAGSGLFLYQQKHHTQVLEKQIRATVNATILAQKRSHVLSAEWDLANDPERLVKLAEQFLSLRTMAPSQFAAMGDLPSRLPAARVPGWKADQTTEEPADGDPVAEAPLPIPPLPAPPPPAVTSPTITSPALARATPTQAPAGVAAAAPTNPAPAIVVRLAVNPTRSASAPVGAPADGLPIAGGHSRSALGMARGASVAPAPVPISATGNTSQYGGN